MAVAYQAVGTTQHERALARRGGGLAAVAQLQATPHAARDECPCLTFHYHVSICITVSLEHAACADRNRNNTTIKV